MERTSNAQLEALKQRFLTGRDSAALQLFEVLRSENQALRAEAAKARDLAVENERKELKCATLQSEKETLRREK